MEVKADRAEKGAEIPEKVQKTNIDFELRRKAIANILLYGGRKSKESYDCGI